MEIALFELAGVSMNGWKSNDTWDDYLVYSDPIQDHKIRIDRNCDVYVEHISGRNGIAFCCDSFCEAIQLADRLKRAILNEPDPRVAVLETTQLNLKEYLNEAYEMINELRAQIEELHNLLARVESTGNALYTGISIANERNNANIEGPVVSAHQETIYAVSAELRKVRNKP